MANEPTGGRKKKFSISIAATEITMAIGRRARVAVPSTTSSSATVTVVGLMPGRARSDAVTAAMAPRDREEDDDVSSQPGNAWSWQSGTAKAPRCERNLSGSGNHAPAGTAEPA